ncbi:MAG TPA: phage tail protein [Pyrinomonadaceae bacterium]|jgi:phage tail-like protein
MPRDANDPFASFNFTLEFDNVVIAGFSECTGLNSEQNVIEYREGNESITPRKLPGLTKFGNITLKRGVVLDFNEFFTWRKTVMDGDITRKTVAIALHNEKHDEVTRWTLHRAWPSKYTGPDLKASANEVAVESIEIAHEGLEKA